MEKGPTALHLYVTTCPSDPVIANGSTEACVVLASAVREHRNLTQFKRQQTCRCFTPYCSYCHQATLTTYISSSQTEPTSRFQARARTSTTKSFSSNCACETKAQTHGAVCQPRCPSPTDNRTTTPDPETTTISAATNTSIGTASCCDSSASPVASKKSNLSTGRWRSTPVREPRCCRNALDSDWRRSII